MDEEENRRWGKTNTFCLNTLFNIVLEVFFFLINLFIYFWLLLGLRCCTQAYSSCGEWGLLFVAVRGLIAVVSLVAECGLQ